jgi:transcriptional regulator with XRE-family HTH domain
MRDAAQKLVKARKAEKLSQVGMAAKLGVTANTVARWERREIPIPQWVPRLQLLEEEHLAERVKFERQITRLTRTNADLDCHVRRKGEEISALKARIGRSGPNKAHKFYHELLKEFHPDRNPADADAMQNQRRLSTVSITRTLYTAYRDL